MLPATFNVPKSHLQCYGESVYCINKDLLTICNQCESPLERFTSVVAWSISTARPTIFGSAPFNSVLGETHHVSSGNLNVLLEQVSHHPPVSALHATNEKENIELIWCQHPVAKFYGTSVEAEVHGKRQLKLHKYKETYEMNSPKLLIRFLPVPGTEWVGNAVWPSESAAVWAEVSQGILNQEWEKARDAKKSVEEEQRKLLRERESAGETWVPQHFHLTQSKERGWDCSPIRERVPPAPIVVPL
ncbi:hypothetical protein Pint_14030 [Pistacia integerrima]|uniref:Uncharacterized protein n=1 Tax=Pistacia integerrima TaxID=434235 RepID=A0ACC0Y5V0_9ROSI|nr:hypothetical protein Pint_14030 [Pistacia integerrima]